MLCNLSPSNTPTQITLVSYDPEDPKRLPSYLLCRAAKPSSSRAYRLHSCPTQWRQAWGKNGLSHLTFPLSLQLQCACVCMMCLFWRAGSVGVSQWWRNKTGGSLANAPRLHTSSKPCRDLYWLIWKLLRSYWTKTVGVFPERQMHTPTRKQRANPSSSPTLRAQSSSCRTPNEWARLVSPANCFCTLREHTAVPGFLRTCLNTSREDTPITHVRE